MWAGKMMCPDCLKEHREGQSSPAQDRADDNGDMLGSMPLTRADAQSSDDSPAPRQRPAQNSGLNGQTGARGMRTFHAKLTEGAIRHLDEQVNSWLKRHPEISIKFANSTVGQFDAKQTEPNLLLTVFY
jgi:hypothetical protein